FTFTATQSGSTFECNLDGAGFSSCPSPKSYSGVADGAHTFQVRAIDPAGNADGSPDSYSWTIDATPPDTSIGPSQPAALTTVTGATFDFSSNEAGSTFECRLDGGSSSSCTTPRTYSGLADGSHIFEVRATDQAGNVDTSPAAYIWQIDNVAPSAPTLTSPIDATLTNSLPQLRATFDDATAGGDTGTVQFAVCSTSVPAGTACAPVVQSSSSGTVPSGSSASWAPAALP